MVKGAFDSFITCSGNSSVGFSGSCDNQEVLQHLTSTWTWSVSNVCSQTSRLLMLIPRACRNVKKFS